MDKILIIEDDVEINTLLTDFLNENGYVVYSQYDGLHDLDFLHKEKIDLIILEVRSGNEPAIHLYRTCGFGKIGVRKNFYQFPRDDADIMEWKRLC